MVIISNVIADDWVQIMEKQNKQLEKTFIVKFRNEQNTLS